MSALLLFAFAAAPALVAPAVFLPGRPGALARAAGAWAAFPPLVLALLPVEYPPVDLDWLLLGARFDLDPSGRVFLVLTAAVWAAAGTFARTYVAPPGRDRFAFFFLLTMAGNLVLPLAGDAVSFYAAFSVMTFAGYGLVLHRGDAAARRAGAVYVAIAVIGELFLLVGLIVAAAAAGGIGLDELPARLAASPAATVVTVLLLLGFGFKAGIVPLHVWLPLAHPVAPTPASAALSGAMIKAGILGWLRFLPAGTVALPDIGALVVAAGLASVFFAAAVGLLQREPKTVLAYSSVSQVGLMAVAVGVGLASPAAASTSAAAAAIFALHHGIAKAGLFLGVAVMPPPSAPGWARTTVAAALAFLALALAGMPLTSGALAKSGLKQTMYFAPGAWSAVIDPLLTISGGATTLLMARFLALVTTADASAGDRRPGPGLWVPWAALVAAVAVMPVAAGSRLGALGLAAGSVSATPPDLASALVDLGPIAVAAAGFAAAASRWRAWAAGASPPAVEPGDILRPFEAGVRRLAAVATRPAAAETAGPVARLAEAWFRLYSRGDVEGALARAERALTRWATAVTLVLVVAATIFLFLARGP